MDTANPTGTNQSELLKQWWESKSFEGKEFCTLDENGALSIAPNLEKIVSTLNTFTGDAVIQSLIEKYKDIEKQSHELEEEWDKTSDKLKLLNKISRLKDYINQVNAIGNKNALLQKIKNYDHEINAIIELNYQEKCALITEAEGISVEQNNWKDITQKFRALTDKWKTLGYVDKKRNDELWEKLEQLKAKFFEDKRNHQEDIGKEMLQNLDLKMELVDKAESIAASENWKETTEAFKQLMNEWKQTGRTLPEKNEALWQRFIAAQNNFYDRKKQHTDQIRVEQEQNFLKKSAIVEKAESIKDSSEWSITTQAFNDLMTEWKTIGSVPAEHSNSLWERFSAAKEVFFNAKKAQADAFRAKLDENYTKKTSLIERAEAIKNSNNWRDATEEMNSLFEEWKKTGQVGKEHSDSLWEQFISARKHFFNRKDQDRERRKQQYEKNKELHFIQTKNFLATLEHESIDEEAQIIEFKENLNNISEGPKSDELKAHLTKLIVEIEQRIKNRAPKIAELQAQVQQLNQELNQVSTAADEETKPTL